MTTNEHKAHHTALHRSLDELIADFLTHNPTRLLSTTSILDLLAWSGAQTQHPTEEPRSFSSQDHRDFSDYDWDDRNRDPRFKTWLDEVKHCEALGYTLCAPNYHIPHWSQVMAGTTRKLYTYRNRSEESALGEFTLAADRPARDLGYPVYIKNDAP